MVKENEFLLSDGNALHEDLKKLLQELEKIQEKYHKVCAEKEQLQHQQNAVTIAGKVSQCSFGHCHHYSNVSLHLVTITITDKVSACLVRATLLTDKVNVHLVSVAIITRSVFIWSLSPSLTRSVLLRSELLS